MPITTEPITHCPACTKDLNHENCASWSRDTGFHPRPCESCRRVACDNCSEHWAICVCCGGGICQECAVSARSRRVTDAPAYGAPCRTRTEFLCAKCATNQDVIVQAIAASLVGIGTDEDGRWLSDIVSELSEALRSAKDAL